MTSPPPVVAASQSADGHNWTWDYLLWIPLALIAWRLAWKFQDPFISDWDGFDYTVQAVVNQPTPLGLGRAIFLGYNHWLWEIAHRVFSVPVEQAYIVFRYGVIAQSGVAIVGAYAAAKELTASRIAAVIAGAILVFSPFFTVYSGRVMSEIPGFLVFFWALWWMLRSLRLGQKNQFLLAALLFGVSVNLREFAIFYLWTIPVLARCYRMKWIDGFVALALACAGALAGFTFWAIYSPDFYLPAVIKWWKLSASERRIHNVSSANFWFLRTYAYESSVAGTVIGPIATVFLAFRRELRPLFVISLAGLIAGLVLLINHDLSVNPRYLLTALPGLAFASGWAISEIAKWRADAAMGILLILAGLQVGLYTQLGKERYDQEWNARAGRAYLSRIGSLPANSVFIAGSRTPLVNFYAGLKARPEWESIQPGSAWPDDRLDEVIRTYLAEGRPVFVDFDKDLWNPGARESAREVIGLEMIRREYELAPVNGSIFRIVRRGRGQ